MYELLLIPLFFFFFLFLRIRKIKSFDHIGFIYSIWLFASFCGFLYTQTDILYQGKGIVKIEAVTYMLLMFYITMQPMEKSCQLTKKNYIINSSQLITWTMYIIAACSYLPFVENVLHLGSGNTLSTLSDNYGAQEIRNFDARAHMSWLGARLNSVTMLCKYITPILLMNYL